MLAMPGPEDGLLRPREQDRGVRHHFLAAEAFGYPYRRISELLVLARRGRLLGRGQSLQGEAPDIQRAQQLCQAPAAVAADA